MRAGLNHARDAHGGLVGKLILEHVEGCLRHGAVRVRQVPALDLGPEHFVGRVAIEVVGREDRHRDLAIGRIDGEVAGTRRLVAVGVLRRLDPLPPRVAAPHRDLEDPQPTRIRHGLEGRLPLLEEGLQGGPGDGTSGDLEMQLGELLDGRLHDASTLLTFQYTPVVLKSPHSCLTISKQNAVRSNAGSRRTSSLLYHLIIRSPEKRNYAKQSFPYSGLRMYLYLAVELVS